MDFISPVFWYIITIGVLVAVHEWGHFIVARACGVHVERFSIGFGRALLSRIGRNGTEYRLALIPFGGYVKMLDERDGEVPAELRPYAFNRQPVGRRIAIVAAGPIANLILCVALLWAAFGLGVQELRPLLGPAQGLAQQAGFQAGDELRAVDGRPVQTWNDALPPLALAAIDRRPVRIEVDTAAGESRTRHLALDRLPADFEQGKLLQEIGFSPYFAAPAAIVGAVEAGSPADGILRAGDRISAIDGVPVSGFNDIAAVLKERSRAGVNLTVDVARGGEQLRFLIEPKPMTRDGETRWRLGIASPAATKTVQYPFWQALPKAVGKTADMTANSLSVIKRLLTGAASMANLSGPVGIAQAADHQAGWGLAAFLSFLAAVSLALCIMNLLPIPVLDGGHLLYFAIEWATGRPLSEAAQAIGQRIGLVLLAALLGMAIFSDFFRIIS